MSMRATGAHWGAALCWLAIVSAAAAASLEQLLPELGGTFCKYLAYKSQIHRKYFRECPEQNCNWRDWQKVANSTDAKRPQRIILSYGHNGFGNQLWEHTVAFMIAQSLNAHMYIAVIPDSLSPGGYIPPNSWSGYNALEKILPPEFIYESLPENSSVRALCDRESFFIADRPVDWRNRNYSSNFKQQLVGLVADPQPRCLKMIGYFQNLPLCAEDTKRLWRDRLVANVTQFPGENDISIYLRCIPRHYHFNTREYYEAVLNHTRFEKVWLFTAPECPTKLDDNPHKDGPVAAVFRLLYTRYNATKWPEYKGTDENMVLLHDLAGLVLSNKLVLPSSSWAFWAGFLSNASEVHVNAPPMHHLLPNANYVYHHEKGRHYYGRYNATTGDIDYAVDLGRRDAEQRERDKTEKGAGHSGRPHEDDMMEYIRLLQLLR